MTLLELIYYLSSSKLSSTQSNYIHDLLKENKLLDTCIHTAPGNIINNLLDYVKENNPKIL